MPKFRSITLSVVSQWELRLHPEYPHPKSQKFIVPSPGKVAQVRTGDDEDDEEEEVQEYSYVSGTPGTTPQVSVYIPSCPGTRFWIRYAISPDHPPAKLFYFKLYLNGRHISSWGINPKKRPQGQIMRAFFNPEPAEDTHSKHAGIQARQFYFASESESEAGLDGGLIEIKCFRARGRRRRSPDPEDFRGGQEKYGLDLPKGNLLDFPEDARYYDWLLVDPKDSPYASFRFHYRAWEHLVALSLIPPQDPRILLTRTSSMWSTNRDAYAKDESEVSAAYLEKAMEDEEILEFHEELTLQDSGRPLPVPGARPVKSVSERPPTPFAMDLFGTREPSGRHLPIPPNRREPTLHRTSSTISTANSITPSLYAYVDRQKNSDSPEPYVGLAASVSMTLSSANYVDDSVWDDGLSQLTVESPPRGNRSPSPGSKRSPEAMSPARSARLENQSPGNDDDSIWDDGLSQLSVESPAHSNKSPRHDTKRASYQISPGRAAPVQSPSADDVEDSFWDDGLSQLSIESPRHGNTFPSHGAMQPSETYYGRPTLQDDSLSHSSAESTVRGNPFSGYGILRPPEAIFSPANVAALRESRGLPTVASYSDMFRIHTDHDRLPQVLTENMALSRSENSTFLEQEDSSGGLTGDEWLLQTPAPIRKKYEEIQAGRLRDVGMCNDENDVDSTHSTDEVIESEQAPEHVKPSFMPRSQSRPTSGTWI